MCLQLPMIHKLYTSRTHLSVAMTSGANEDRLMRSKRIIRTVKRRRAQKGSYTAIIDEDLKQDPNRKVLEEGSDDVNQDYEDSSEELDNNVLYRDDDEEEKSR